MRGNPHKLRRTGRFQFDSDLSLLLQDPLQQGLLPLDRQTAILDIVAASRRHQKENVMRHRAPLDGQIGDIQRLRLVPVHHRGMDLKRQAAFPASFHSGNGGFPGPFGLAEPIVPLSGNTVHADARRRQAGLFQLRHLGRRQQNAVRAQHRPQLFRPGVGDQFRQVRPQQRLAAGKDKDAKSAVRRLVEQPLAFRRCQFVPQTIPCIAIAMQAVDIASLGRIPGNQHFLASFAASVQKQAGSSPQITPSTDARIRQPPHS